MTAEQERIAQAIEAKGRRVAKAYSGDARGMYELATAAAAQAARVEVGSPDLWHAPWPGPGHWDWRCRTCSEPVSDHPSWWRRLLRRIAESGGSR